jgi:uncharacterized protein (TIGR03086 family)
MATDDSAGTPSAGTEPLTLLSRAVDQAGEVIARVGPDQADLPTPCRSWSVRQLVDHLIYDLDQFVTMAKGGRGDWSEPTPPSGDDWMGTYRARADELMAAWGKADLSGTTEMPGMGQVPARMPVDMQIVELAVHTWDLAVATGQPTRLDPEVAEVGLAFMRNTLAPQYRGSEEDGKSFGPEVQVPAGAPPYERLAAFAGRRAAGS